MAQQPAVPAAPETLNDLGIVGLRRLITETHCLFRARDLAWAKFWELEAASDAALDAWTKACDAHQAAFHAWLDAPRAADGRSSEKRGRLKSAEAKADVEKARRYRAWTRARAATDAFYAAHLAGGTA